MLIEITICYIVMPRSWNKLYESYMMRKILIVIILYESFVTMSRARAVEKPIECFVDVSKLLE